MQDTDVTNPPDETAIEDHYAAVQADRARRQAACGEAVKVALDEHVCDLTVVYDDQGQPRPFVVPLDLPVKADEDSATGSNGSAPA